VRKPVGFNLEALHHIAHTDALPNVAFFVFSSSPIGRNYGLGPYVTNAPANERRSPEAMLRTASREHLSITTRGPNLKAGVRLTFSDPTRYRCIASMPRPVSAWSDLHDLALVYLAFPHSARASSGPPRDARRRLAERYPDVSDERLHQAFHEALLMHVGVAGAAMLDVSVASLGQSLPRSHRLAVLDDLAGLASDGADEVDLSGRSFIQSLAVRWDLQSMPGRDE
jgi:hypothetical protein